MQITGRILILMATTIMGIYIGNIPLNRKKDLLQLKKAINILSSEIERQTQLKIAMKNISQFVNFPFNEIFKNFVSLIGEESPKEAFERSMKKYEKKTYINKEDIEIVNNCFSVIGSVDNEAQKNALSHLGFQLDIAINECSEIAIKHKKMYVSLGVSFGLLINVLIF